MSKRGHRKIRHLIDPPRKTASVPYYFCVLIDILQQGQKLREIADLDLSTQREEIGERLGETWGLVESLRKNLATMREAALRPVGPPSPNISASEWGQIKNFQLHTMSFSDLVCVFGSIDDKRNNIPIWGLWHALTAAASQMLMYLSKGVPLRGGAAISTGWEIESPLPLPNGKFKMGTCRFHRELYGPALCVAHDIESKSADYPRIVVSEQVLDYIDRGHKEFQDWRGSVFQLVADLCRQLLTRDLDEHLIIDYLGPGYRDQLLYSSPHLAPDLTNAFSEAQKFVLREHTRFCQKLDNSDSPLEIDSQENLKKLAARYDSLAKYFASRRRVWE